MNVAFRKPNVLKIHGYMADFGLFWTAMMAEIELNVLGSQCLNRRIDDIEVVRKESSAWQEHRNNKGAKVNWQFTTKNARTKLRRLYPTLES